MSWLCRESFPFLGYYKRVPNHKKKQTLLKNQYTRMLSNTGFQKLLSNISLFNISEYENISGQKLGIYP
jgi:hypothetical protein